MAASRQLLNASLMSHVALALEVTVLAGVHARGSVLMNFGCDISWPFLKRCVCVRVCVCIWGHQLRIDLIQFSLCTKHI